MMPYAERQRWAVLEHTDSLLRRSDSVVVRA